MGWLAYLPPALAASRLSPSSVHLIVDGEQVEARSPLILVANAGSVIAPGFRLYPGIAPDDGWLDLLLFTPTSRAETMSLLARAVRMSLERSPHVRRWRVKHVRIEADPPLTVQLDGDVRGVTPREFTIIPRGISIVTPPASNVMSFGEES